MMPSFEDIFISNRLDTITDRSISRAGASLSLD